jgi:hypothetical protein
MGREEDVDEIVAVVQEAAADGWRNHCLIASVFIVERETVGPTGIGTQSDAFE